MRYRQIYAAAAINGLELHTPEGFDPSVTNNTPEYLAKFPLGKTPTLETPSGFRLIESGAIAHYLASSGPKRDQMLGTTPEARATIQQWILFNELQLDVTLFQLGSWRFGGQDFDEEKEANGGADLERWLAYCESHLEGRTWFADGDWPSLADLTIGGTLFALLFIYIDAEMRKGYPNVLKFYERLRQIPELAQIYPGQMIEKREMPE